MSWDPAYYQTGHMQRTDSGYGSVASPSFSDSCDSGFGYTKSEPTFSPTYVECPSYPSTSQRPEYVCIHPACSVKPFNRSADLGRHVQQVHNDKSQKKSYVCDYSKCQRNCTEPFYRKDHFRDHLRDYHKEDLPKRTTKSSSGSRKQDPLNLRGTNISATWWRCSRCLSRNKVPYWKCSKEGCTTECEMERIEARLGLR